MDINDIIIFQIIRHFAFEPEFKNINYNKNHLKSDINKLK